MAKHLKTSILVQSTMRKTLIATLVTGCYGAAWAQEGAALAPVEIYSSSRTAIPGKDLPASIQVVPQEVLRERGVTRTDQLLDSVSGVVAEASYGGNGATFFNIRGFSESNGLRDGFRNFGYFAFRDVQNIDRVEVFKGPAGALYGGVGAVGGYLNTVSKRPEATNFGDVGLTVGSYSLMRATVDGNRALSNDVSVRINAAAERNGGFRDNADYDSWSIAPALSWNIGGGASLTLLTEFNHLNRKGFDFGVSNVPNYRDLSRTRYYGLKDGVYPGLAGDFGRNDTQAATLLFEQRLSERWKLRLASHYSNARQVSTQTFPNSMTPTGSRLDVTTYSNADESSRQYAVQAEVLGDLSLGGFKHSLLAGIDTAYLQQGGRGSTMSAWTLDLVDPTFVSPVADAGSLTSHQGQGRDLGLYVQDLIDLTPQLKLLAGVRADRFVNKALVSDAETSSGSQTAWSPRVGLVWQGSPDTTLFSDWSRSHSPNVGHGVSENTFDAEIAEQIEFGVKHELVKNRLNATVAVFDIKRSNMLTTDPLDPTRQVLTGKQASRGLEVDVAGTVTPGWKVIATYTYTDTAVKSDTNLPVGDALSNVPRHHASAWSSYKIQGVPGLGVGAGLYFVGEREANLPNTYKLPSYVRADASLTYQQDGWRTQLNLLNLFNSKYYTGGSAGTFNFTLDPSRPVSAQLTISHSF